MGTSLEYPPIPNDWIVLTRHDTDHYDEEYEGSYVYSNIKAAVIEDNQVSVFYATCWLEEPGMTLPSGEFYKAECDKEWRVDPEAGASLSIEEFKKIANLLKLT